LSAAATFDIDDGELHVTTKDGLTTLTFERVRSSSFRQAQRCGRTCASAPRTC
jgi:hypothetical protein